MLAGYARVKLEIAHRDLLKEFDVESAELGRDLVGLVERLVERELLRVWEG